VDKTPIGLTNWINFSKMAVTKKRAVLPLTFRLQIATLFNIVSLILINILRINY